MKVIIIKDCKDGKANQVIDVKDGYAKNFLIKNGYALPINKATTKQLNDKIVLEKESQQQSVMLANKVKNAIEKITLKFALKSVNNVVHGSISRKQILHELNLKGIKVPSHSIANAHIASIGKTILKIKLAKDIYANLIVEVENGK